MRSPDSLQASVDQAGGCLIFACRSALGFAWFAWGDRDQKKMKRIKKKIEKDQKENKKGSTRK